MRNPPGIREDQQVPALPSLQQVPERKEENFIMGNLETGEVKIKNTTGFVFYYVVK